MNRPVIRSMADVQRAIDALWSFVNVGQPLVRMSQLQAPMVKSATTSTGINSGGGTVNVSGSAAPVAGQVLTATSATTATWQHPGYANTLMLMGG